MGGGLWVFFWEETMDSLQIQDAFQPYYAGRESSDPTPARPVKPNRERARDRNRAKGLKDTSADKRRPVEER